MSIHLSFDKERGGYPFYLETGLSIELGMGQILGAIQGTQYTRKITFGFGWGHRNDLRSWDLYTRCWITGHRTDHEPEPNKCAWHFYWRPYDGFTFRRYL